MGVWHCYVTSFVMRAMGKKTCNLVQFRYRIVAVVS